MSGLFEVTMCPKCKEIFIRGETECPWCGSMCMYKDGSGWAEFPRVNPLRVEIAGYFFKFGKFLGGFGIFCLLMVAVCFFLQENQYFGFLIACALGSWILKPVFEAIAGSIYEAGLPKK